MNTGFLSDFFSNIAKKDSYKSVAYILLSVPLSIIYFTLIITGIALGMGLFIVWIGIPLLILTLGLSWWFGVFEVNLAKKLLNAKIERTGRNVAKEITIWQRLKTHLKNTLTWKILTYEILKLPIAIASFTIFLVFLSVTIGFISVPFIYTAITINWGFWTITTIWDALILLAIGLIMLFVTLDITVFLGKLNRLFAEAFLLQKAEIEPNTTIVKNDVQARTEHKIQEVQQIIVPPQMQPIKPDFKIVTRTMSIRKLQKKVPTKTNKQANKAKTKKTSKKTIKKNPKKTTKRKKPKKKKTNKKTTKKINKKSKRKTQTPKKISKKRTKKTTKRNLTKTKKQAKKTNKIKKKKTSKKTVKKIPTKTNKAKKKKSVKKNPAKTTKRNLTKTKKQTKKKPTKKTRSKKTVKKVNKKSKRKTQTTKRISKKATTKTKKRK